MANYDDERANRNFSIIGITVIVSALIGFVLGSFMATLLLT